MSSGFEVNDLGFQLRSDVMSTSGWLGYVHFEPGRVVRRWDLWTNGWARWTLDGERDRLTANIFANVQFQNNWMVVTEVRTMDEIVETAQATTRLSLIVIGAFGMFAGLLAAVGLYGVLATLVQQRTAEIGVRMALGAAPARVVGLVVRYGLRLSIVGVAFGLLAASLVTRAMKGMLVGVQPTDSTTVAAVVLLFIVLVAVSSWLPARRAARLDPVDALQQE